MCHRYNSAHHGTMHWRTNGCGPTRFCFEVRLLYCKSDVLHDTSSCRSPGTENETRQNGQCRLRTRLSSFIHDLHNVCPQRWISTSFFRLGVSAQISQYCRSRSFFLLLLLLLLSFLLLLLLLLLWLLLLSRLLLRGGSDVGCVATVADARGGSRPK